MVGQVVFEQGTEAALHFLKVGLVDPQGIIGVESNDLNGRHDELVLWRAISGNFSIPKY
jgi:hypothetical protein